MQYWESEMRMLFHTAVDPLLRCLSSRTGSLKADRLPVLFYKSLFYMFHGDLTGLVHVSRSKLVPLHTLWVLLYLFARRLGMIGVSSRFGRKSSGSFDYIWELSLMRCQYTARMSFSRTAMQFRESETMRNKSYYGVV